MSMPPYPVTCSAPGCPNAAAFKIAARWSDGVTDEFKTYYLSCPACLSRLYASATAKRALCRLGVGETLDAPGIYELHRGERDRQHKRREDLEAGIPNATREKR